jgi:hypothetical protein
MTGMGRRRGEICMAPAKALFLLWLAKTEENKNILSVSLAYASVDIRNCYLKTGYHC